MVRIPRPAGMTIALVGGTGFIGRVLSHQLAKRGCKIRLIARHAPMRLQPHESFSRADSLQPQTLQKALTGCHVVVHLVATLAERGTTFEQTIYHSAANTVVAARNANVKHFVLVSALGASTSSPSAYARAKAHAEAVVRKVYVQATIVQPSLVLGPNSGFTRQIENLTRFAPVMVLPGRGLPRFQPVDVKALAIQLADACTDTKFRGQTVLAVGLQVKSFRRLVEEELARLGRKRILLPLPWPVTWLAAYVLSLADRFTGYRLIPDWLLVTPDQVRLLQEENIVKSENT